MTHAWAESATHADGSDRSGTPGAAPRDAGPWGGTGRHTIGPRAGRPPGSNGYGDCRPPNRNAASWGVVARPASDGRPSLHWYECGRDSRAAGLWGRQTRPARRVPHGECTRPRALLVSLLAPVGWGGHGGESAAPFLRRHR